MTLHKGAFIGKLKTPLAIPESGFPDTVVENEGHVVYEVLAVSTAHELDYDTYFILAKKVR